MTVSSDTKTTGLRYWMERVLAECDYVAANFSADPVHDLRVALRRCRSMADGMMAMDPHGDWKAMKKAGKRLFQQLGALRDVQIMVEWIEKLHPTNVASAGVSDSSQPERTAPYIQLQSPDVAGLHEEHGNPDPVAHALLGLLKSRESQHKHEARVALAEFDRKQWRHWSKSLPLRAARFRLGSTLFKHLALERWTAARELHTRAMRNRSQLAFHALRIGIKRFRYIVENFLPAEHKAWSNDLKHMQDLLGEVHDLDVLWATAVSSHVFLDEAYRQAWHKRLAEERTKRVEEYRKKMLGAESLWNLWRARLPQGEQIREIATRRIRLWAKALDPDFLHSERVARLALELFDGLQSTGVLTFEDATRVNRGARNGDSADMRDSLYLAALLHDVGKIHGNKGHHKASFDLIKEHGTPLGWKPKTMERAALVARFHCGILPTRSHKVLRDLLADEQKHVIRLAGILRLANALDASHDGRIRRLRIENAALLSDHKRRSTGFLRKPAALGKNEALLIGAEGFVANSSTAQAAAAERYLLETVLHRPIVIKAIADARH